MMRLQHAFLASFMVLTLGACDTVKNQLNLERSSPDEFAVLKRAPLEMPPATGVLPKPQPGAPRPQEQAVASQAKKAVFGEEATAEQQTQGMSEGERLLLEKTGATQTPDDIRAVVDKESEEIDTENQPVVDKLLGTFGGDEKPQGKALDPKEELERLQKENQLPTSKISVPPKLDEDEE